MNSIIYDYLKILLSLINFSYIFKVVCFIILLALSFDFRPKYYKKYNQNYWDNFFSLCFNLIYFVFRLGVRIFFCHYSVLFITRIPKNNEPLLLSWIIFLTGIFLILVLITNTITYVQKKKALQNTDNAIPEQKL